ncbi:MAG TPA: hypothetical protein VH986_06650 [Acidimicrobiia bacterium]
MTCHTATTRLRALGLAAALVVLAGAAIWNDAWTESRTASVQRARTAVDQDTKLVAPSAAEARVPTQWMLPLAALGAALAVALLATGRRLLRPRRAAFPARRRLVHANRRAPPGFAAVLRSS